MRVLLIGGTGIISTDITLLAAQDPAVDLYLINRGNRPDFLPPGIRCIQADIDDVESVRAKIRDLDFDVVADFISYGVASLERKLDLFRGHCGQYLFISSCAAYQYPARFHVLTEENAVVGNPLWSYGRDKALCEQRLTAEHSRTGMGYTIVRPSYTYNRIRIVHPYTINHWRSWTIARRLLRRKPYVIHDDGQQLCTVMHTTDFARAFVGLWGNPAAMNEAFHVTSSEYLTWRRIAEMTAEALGVPLRFCCVPADLLRHELGESAGEKVLATTYHAVYDNAKIRKAVPNFECRVCFDEGHRQTLQFYRDHPEYQQVDEAWDLNLDRIVEKHGHGEAL